jgi:F-type H+-transporting ATPase subunit b
VKRLGFFAASLLFSVAAFAEAPGGAGGAHAGGSGEVHHAHVANWWHFGEQYKESPALGWLAITFVLFFIGLVAIAKKPLNIFLENRADTVRKAIEEAKRAKEDAERRARDAEAKLAALDAEVRRMKSDFESQGRAELERMEKVGRETAARIAKDAEDTINAEIERAQNVLRKEAARLALETAEERIKAALTADDDARLRQSLVQHLQA